MQRVEDEVAAAVLDQYSSLPAKFKPREAEGAGRAEWITLSGIAMRKGDGRIKCVALGAGMKCLPLAKVPTAHGRVLHDWHAEILAVRALNLFLLQECQRVAASGHVSDIVVPQNTTTTPFVLHDDIKIFMYCSEAPCGDASMELVMDLQEDPTPWPVSGDQTGLLGRGSFAELGVVRRKPARADSPETLSKSCSDKLALKQCLSLLSATTAPILSPQNCYLDALVLPHDQHHTVACERAFGVDGRMGAMRNKGPRGAFSFRPFVVSSTGMGFEFSRTCQTRGDLAPKASNTACFWTPHCQEVLINGVLQGRRQDDVRAASQLSRLKMGVLLREVLDLIPKSSMQLHLHRYSTLKESRLLDDRLAMKQAVLESALQNWTRNADDDFLITT